VTINYVPIKTKQNKTDVWAVGWSLATTFTVGFGDVVQRNLSEAIFACFAMFIGTTLFQFILAQLTVQAQQQSAVGGASDFVTFI
jgi:hypothetical protein